VKIELFVGTGRERSESTNGGHDPVSGLLGRRPDVSVELSPTWGEPLRQLLHAAAGALRAMSPHTAALVDAIERTARDGGSPEGGDAAFVVVVSGSVPPPEDQAPTIAGGMGMTTFQPSALTQVEREILARVASGQTDGQIGTAMFMSRRTVQNHLRRIREKTGLLTRAELILWASTLPEIRADVLQT